MSPRVPPRPQSSAEWLRRLKQIRRDAYRLVMEAARLEDPLLDAFDQLRADVARDDLLAVFSGATATLEMVTPAFRSFGRTVKTMTERVREGRPAPDADTETWLRRELGRFRMEEGQP